MLTIVVLTSSMLSVGTNSYFQNSMGQSVPTNGQYQSASASPTPSPSSINNRTGGNQSQDSVSAAARANLTSADFSEVISNLLTGRQGIMNNNSESAYAAINAAGSELFRLRQAAVSDNEELARQLAGQLNPIQNSLDIAREALRDGNITQSLRGVNAADNRLLIILQQIPTEIADDEEGP